MMTQPTLECLYQLRLTGMAQALEEQRRSADIDSLGFEERLALLLEREVACRDDRRLTRLLQLAKLHLPAAVEDIDYRTPRGLDRGQILRLASCQWIREHDNVLLSGATGTGKSYLACALANSACRHSLSTRYCRFSRLLNELTAARADGSYAKVLERLAKTQLLVLDLCGHLGNVESGVGYRLNPCCCRRRTPHYQVGLRAPPAIEGARHRFANGHGRERLRRLGRCCRWPYAWRRDQWRRSGWWYRP